jgi:hypothetical protein
MRTTRLSGKEFNMIPAAVTVRIMPGSRADGHQEIRKVACQQELISSGTETRHTERSSASHAANAGATPTKRFQLNR